jgi:colicin import membrane protein
LSRIQFPPNVKILPDKQLERRRREQLNAIKSHQVKIELLKKEAALLESLREERLEHERRLAQEEERRLEEEKQRLEEEKQRLEYERLLEEEERLLEEKKKDENYSQMWGRPFG